MSQIVECDGKTDEELVALSLENSAFYACLVNRYRAKLMRYIRRISAFSEEDAEDILQEVFLKLYTNLNSFDSSLKFSSWAYRSTHNHVISAYRKVKVRPQSVSLDVFDLDSFQALATDLDMNKQLDLEVVRHHIETILANMDIKYRDALVLKFFEDRSYQEISDILKKPTGTVGTLINRAKKIFIEEFNKLEV